LQEGILNKFQASMPTANANQNVGTYSMRIPLTIREMRRVQSSIDAALPAFCKA
jgi:hypothetical protein